MAADDVKMPKGFIQLDLFDSPPIVIAIQTIAMLSAGVSGKRHFTSVTLNIGPGKVYTSSSTMEELLALIAEQQA